MESLAFDEFIACQADNQDSIIEFHENLYIASSIKHFVAQGVDYLQCRNCLELIGKLDYYDDKGNHDFGKEKPDLYNPYLCDCGQLAPIDFFQYGFWDIAKICDQFEKEYYLSIPKPDTVAGSNNED